MTFDATKPQASESPNQFPAQCQANWARLQTMIAANHVFNTGAAASDGKHKFVVMPEQSSAPTTTGDELALYTKETASISELFLRRESDGTEIQMSSGDPTVAAAGHTFLPGNIIMNWGVKSVTSKSNATVTFSQPYSLAADVYSITTTQKSTSTGSDANGNVETVTSTTFKIYNSSSSTRSYYWMAIGKA